MSSAVEETRSEWSSAPRGSASPAWWPWFPTSWPAMRLKPPPECTRTLRRTTAWLAPLKPFVPTVGSCPMNKRQRAILDFIVASVKRQGYPPSVREIDEAVGLASPSTVHVYLRALEDAGYLRRDP